MDTKTRIAHYTVQLNDRNKGVLIPEGAIFVDVVYHDFEITIITLEPHVDGDESLMPAHEVYVTSIPNGNGTILPDDATYLGYVISGDNTLFHVYAQSPSMEISTINNVDWNRVKQIANGEAYRVHHTERKKLEEKEDTDGEAEQGDKKGNGK